MSFTYWIYITLRHLKKKGGGVMELHRLAAYCTRTGVHLDVDRTLRTLVSFVISQH